MNSKLPSRPPRNMPGMAALLAKAKALDLAEKSPAGVATAAQIADPATRAWAQKVVEPLAQRAVLAERKVANVERVLEHFAAQAARIEQADHPQRQVVEVMIRTLRDVIAATGKEEEAAKEG